MGGLRECRVARDRPIGKNGRMSYFDLEGFRAVGVRPEPFPHLAMDDFLRPEHHAAIDQDFPEIGRPGSFDPSSLATGPIMNEALEELRGEGTAAVVAEKLGIDLRGRPTTITLRGQARAKDGRIHTDSSDKLATLLIYLNPDWTTETGIGCLRLLRSESDIEDYETEVLPRMGTLVAFACAPNAWHGHLPYVGRRRSIQLNWVVDEAAAKRTRARHRRSAFWKKLNPFKPNAATRPAS